MFVCVCASCYFAYSLNLFLSLWHSTRSYPFLRSSLHICGASRKKPHNFASALCTNHRGMPSSKSILSRAHNAIMLCDRSNSHPPPTWMAGAGAFFLFSFQPNRISLATWKNYANVSVDAVADAPFNRIRMNCGKTIDARNRARKFYFQVSGWGRGLNEILEVD